MKYNDEHVPKSPKIVQVDPQCEAAKKVTIHGLRDRGLEVSYSLLLASVLELWTDVGLLQADGFLFGVFIR